MNVAGRKQYLGHRAYFQQLNAPLDGDAERAGRAGFTFGGNRSFRREVGWGAQPETPGWYFDNYAIDLTLRQQGRFIYYEPAAWVTHHYVLSVGQRLRAAYRYGRSEVGGEKPALLPVQEAHALRDRWARLRGECPTATTGALIWYTLTQPLAWAARRLGRGTARR